MKLPLSIRINFIPTELVYFFGLESSDAVSALPHENSVRVSPQSTMRHTVRYFITTLPFKNINSEIFRSTVVDIAQRQLFYRFVQATPPDECGFRRDAKTLSHYHPSDFRKSLSRTILFLGLIIPEFGL
jgi:hypothetical protein